MLANGATKPAARWRSASIQPTKRRRDKHAAKVGAANTFSAVAKAYIAKNARDGLAKATVGKREWFLRLVERQTSHLELKFIL